jgi:uncharacterized protein
MAAPAFHLAFPVADIEATRRFFVDLIGCREGRRAPSWIDFDFFGHQISAHLRPEETAASRTNEVDGDAVPVRHFGVILDMESWQVLADRLTGAGVALLIEPHIRFKGEVGEQATMFFLDPSGNALEFKAFKDMSRVFAA